MRRWRAHDPPRILPEFYSLFNLIVYHFLPRSRHNISQLSLDVATALMDVDVSCLARSSATPRLILSWMQRPNTFQVLGPVRDKKKASRRQRFLSTILPACYGYDRNL